jgi:hypothetical protein
MSETEEEFEGLSMVKLFKEDREKGVFPNTFVLVPAYLTT